MSASVPASLTVQLLTISIVTLQRQLVHNRLANRNRWNGSYDFVVVGAGSAGCVVAARLSEAANITVLLIEAGGPDTVISDIPAVEFGNIGDPYYDWNYVSTPQLKSALAFANPVAHLPRGRVMGGSSSMNAMAYVRGSGRLYDAWADKHGAGRDWSYERVLPYFMRAENNFDERIVAANPGYHGTNGPLAITSAVDPDPIMVRLGDTFAQFGYPSTDINAATQLGSMLRQSTIAPNGVQSTAANSYLQPVFERRPNLHIISRALVTKILTRRTADNRLEAVGVRFTRDGREYTVNAGREVILSAGAINTPQLLMLSGIGPADHLRALDIPVVADLPVGDNLMDHIIVTLNYLLNNASDVTSNPELSLSSLYQYYGQGSGPLTRCDELYAFLNTPLNDDDLEWPDGLITVTIIRLSRNLSDMTAGFIRDRIPEWNAYYAPFAANGQLTIGFAPIIVRPKSRGTVRLASRDPTAAPLIDPNFYGDARDLAVHVALTRRTLEIADSAAARELVTVSAIPVPGCQPCGPSVPLYDCYSYIVCVIQSVSDSYYHPCGTCRMGAAGDPRAVVDQRLRVRGVSRLRVIDASVFPEIPNGNTNAATIMVAERGSDLVKQDYH